MLFLRLTPSAMIAAAEILMSTITIGIVGYEQIQGLDLIGPMEAFDAANSKVDDSERTYHTLVLSADGKPFRTEAGLRISADMALRASPALDTIIVPGGRGLREKKVSDPIVRWLKTRAPRTRRMVSICTGIYAFGEAGLLEGRRATTHWRFARDVARRYPQVRLDADALFVKDGALYSSAGITAGIDLTLALIEEDFGERVSLAAARELVVYLKRTGGQMQFSEPLQFQMRSVDRFADLASWMLRNLRKDLPVEVLAERAGLGARHFSRRFKTTFGISPATYVETLRLDEARRRLPRPHQTVDSVAASVGYASADAFRRAFERRFGIAPSLYRKRFSSR
jgi:transcriptional regulator GlxA family with amidase domain